MSEAQFKIKLKIQEDMKDAMRAREREKLGAIRLILAAIKQREVDERIELDDSQVLQVLDKMAKQRRESISQYQQAGRDDLVAGEELELDVISQYLPTPLTDEEVDSLISEAIKSTGASSMREMGQVMAVLKPQIQGRADGAVVSKKVKDQLG